MKRKSTELSWWEPTDEEVREYAYHLYEQSGCIPGRDAENWLQALEYLRARGQPVKPDIYAAKRAQRLAHHR